MNTLPAFLTGPRRKLLARLVVIGLGQGLLAVATAWLVREVFDSALNGDNPAVGLPAAAALLTGIAVTTGLLRVRERIDAEALGQSWVYELRDALFRRLVRSPSRARRNRGGVLVRFTGDMTAIRQWISLGLARLTVAGLTIVVAAGALGVIEPLLAGVVLGVAAISAVTTLLLAPRLRAAIARGRRQRVRLVATVTDLLTGMNAVRACGGEGRERRRLRRRGRKLRQAMLERAAFTGGLRGISEAGTALAAAAAVIAGAWGVANAGVSAGTVVAAMAVISILLPQFRQLSRVYEYWQAARVSLDKVSRQLTRGPQVRGPRRGGGSEPVAGELCLENVSVDGALHQVNAVAQPGQRIIIVGPNGAGKSTLLALVPRLLDPDSGRVLIDGRDARAWPLASLRAAVGLATPDAPLLRGSVRRNLCYRARHVAPGEFNRVLHLCDVNTLVRRLPRGLDTRLQAGGANLSVGERQRLLLARALMNSPPILLLDEPDAHLDAATRDALDRVLDDYAGTVLMVTHDLRRQPRADAIWQLTAGRLSPITAPDRTGDGLAAALLPRAVAG